MGVDQGPIDLPKDLRPDRAHAVRNRKTVDALVGVVIDQGIRAVRLRTDARPVRRLSKEVGANTAEIGTLIANFRRV